jgi:hypothetical protein
MSDETTPVAPEGTPAVTPDAAPTEQNWLLSMPEDLQNDPTLNNYKNIEEMARGFVETKRMVGDRVKIPDENTPPEEAAKFFTRLGRPETPDGYEFTSITKPEPTGDIVLDQEATNTYTYLKSIQDKNLEVFKPIFHELNISKVAADKLQQKYMEIVSENDKIAVLNYNKDKEQKLEVLKTRWGDDFETNKTKAINTFMSFADPALQITVENEGWGNNPDFVELFHKIGLATSEDKMRSPGTAVFTSLDDKIKAIDVEIFNMEESNPLYRDKSALREALYKERYPERPK